MSRQFQPGANVPMMTETHRRLALELRMSAETLIARPSPASFNQLSKMFAALSRAGLTGGAIELGSSTMCGVCDRFERVGKVGMKDTEIEQLRIAVAAIDRQLPTIPTNKFRRAVTEIRIYCADIGA